MATTSGVSLSTDHPDIEVDGESSPDQTVTSSSGVVESTRDTSSPDAATASAETGHQAEEDEDVQELISPERYEALKGNPEKLRKELNRAATKKFQKLAEQRRALEPYQAFIDAFNEDPAAALSAIAPQYGLEVKTKDTPKVDQVDLNQVAISLLREAAGPEYEELAERLGPALTKLITTAAAEASKPLIARQEALVRESGQRELAANLEAFTKRHPDWQQVEPQMVALTKLYPQGPGVKDQDYLESMYILATHNRTVGSRTKETLSRMVKSAETASRDASPVAANQVALRPAGLPSFRDAAAAAARGERYD